jgi:indole-3-glycerol phosphate synthase
VLTDAPYFQGHDSYLIAARGAVSLPVPAQGFHGRPLAGGGSARAGRRCDPDHRRGARRRLMAEIEAARRSGLAWTCWSKCTTPRNWTVRSRSKSRLIGVNNRDLRDFTVDFARTYELVGRAPAGCTFVAESGLTAMPISIRDGRACGVHCFLVGEALMRQPDVEAATRQLLGVA